MSDRTGEYFVPGDDINLEVITADIARYLGNDALVRPGIYEDPWTRQIQQGYFITAYRNLTTAMIADLKADSELWKAGKRKQSSRGQGSLAHAYGYRTPPLLRSTPDYGLSAEAAPAARQAGVYQAAIATSNNEDYYLPHRGSAPGQYVSSTGLSEALPVIEHLKHRKKYLPIHLNGRLCKACADFGAAANIIEATLARELNLEIILDEYCLPFELPTFNKLIKPVGRTKIRCEFPDEPDTHKEYDFFVFENLVFPAIVGRHFLRDTKTFDVFRKRLYERPVQVHDVPIVAFLGVEKESLKCWLDGEELASTPDIGSEINAMSLEFARKRKFVIEEDPIHQVCFADGSVQDVEGRISVPVSFGNGAPPSLLLKQVDLSPNSGGELQTRSCDADGKIDYGSTAPILVDFHILSGLNVDIIFGEDLLATVNTFVRHSTDFNDVVNPTSLYPGLAAMGPVSKVARPIYEAIGKRGPQTVVPLGEQDIAGSKGLDRYKREVERIKGLGGEERRRAQRRNERKRREYNERRSRT